MRKILPILILALVLCLSFSYQQAKINSLKNELAHTQLETSNSGHQTNAARGDISHTPESRRPLRTRTLGSSSNISEKYRKTNSDETLIRQGMSASVNGIYGPFLKLLNLNEEDAQYLEGLLAERLFHRHKFIGKWANAPEEQRQLIEAEIQQIQSQNEAQIEKFLNHEEDYQAFKKYEPRIPEYQNLPNIRQALTTTPPTPEQEAQLIEILYKSRIESEGQLQEGLSNWLAITEPPSTEEIQRQWNIANRQLFEQLPEILDETQQELFLALRQDQSISTGAKN